MRKTLALIALVALAALWMLTAQAIYGADPLPPRIPTHFDAAGKVNGWGEPRMLWLFPIIATFVSGLMTLVSFYPQTFNFPVRVTPRTRRGLESIALSMIAWLRVEIVGLFLWIQYTVIQTARTSQNRISLLVMPLAIALVFATIFAHVIAMTRAARNGHGQLEALSRFRGTSRDRDV